MSEKFIVVQGAMCKCQYGTLPDNLKVLSHKKEIANDKDGTQKLVATTKEIGAATFEKNTFGNCSKMGNPPPPCQPSVTGWEDFYKQATLSNGGNAIVESSKAICAVAGTACIEVVKHGQSMEATAKNFEDADDEVQNLLNPATDTKALVAKVREHPGLADKAGDGARDEPKFIGDFINTSVLSPDNHCVNGKYLNRGLGTNVRPDLAFFNGIEIQFLVSGDLKGHTLAILRTADGIVRGDDQELPLPKYGDDGPHEDNLQLTPSNGRIYSIDMPGFNDSVNGPNFGAYSSLSMMGNFTETAYLIKSKNGSVEAHRSVQWHSIVEIIRNNDGVFEYSKGDIGAGHVKIR